MKISELESKLKEIRENHGDLNVHIITNDYSMSSLPNYVMGAGGEGWSKNWHGTIKDIGVSKEYPDQLEITPVK